MGYTGKIRPKKYAVYGGIAAAGLVAVLVVLSISLRPEGTFLPEEFPETVPYEEERPATPQGQIMEDAQLEELPILPSATLSNPSTAPVGDQITIAGDGFTPNEPVIIALNDNEIETEEPIMTDDLGVFSVEIDIPEMEEGEELVISASDESGRAASSTLTVIS